MAGTQHFHARNPGAQALDHRRGLALRDTKLYVIDPATDATWDDVVQECPSCTFFHTMAWARVLAGSYGYRPVYFMIRNRSVFTGALPVMEVRSALTGRRGVSLPFSDYCDPLSAGETSTGEIVRSVIRSRLTSNWKYLEIRDGHSSPTEIARFASHYRHDLALAPDPKSLLPHFHRTTKQGFRKATDQGVTVARSRSMDALLQFYRLNCITRKRHGIPPQPLRFFKKIHEEIMAKDRGDVFLAIHDDRPIAGAVFFSFKDKTICKYLASDIRYQLLRPTNLLIWEAIKRYCVVGFKEFSFGRTGLADSGLARFKEGWGAKARLIHHYRYDMKKRTFIAGGRKPHPLVRAGFRHMPMPVLKTVGSVLYSHVG